MRGISIRRALSGHSLFFSFLSSHAVFVFEMIICTVFVWAISPRKTCEKAAPKGVFWPPANCRVASSLSMSSTSTSNTVHRPQSNRLTVEYIRPSRQSVQEYNDFLNDADVFAAAAASNNLDLLNKINNRLSSKHSSSSKSTAGM